MTKAILQTYDSINNNIRIINSVFIVGCFLLAGLYIASVFSVISKTVTLQKIESKISVLSGDVNNLDSEYLSIAGKITPDNLLDYGMTKGQVNEYITRSVEVKIGISNSLNHVALNER